MGFVIVVCLQREPGIHLAQHPFLSFKNFIILIYCLFFSMFWVFFPSSSHTWIFFSPLRSLCFPVFEIYSAIISSYSSFLLLLCQSFPSFRFMVISHVLHINCPCWLSFVYLHVFSLLNEFHHNIK